MKRIHLFTGIHAGDGAAWVVLVKGGALRGINYLAGDIGKGVFLIHGNFVPLMIGDVCGKIGAVY